MKEESDSVASDSEADVKVLLIGECTLADYSPRGARRSAPRTILTATKTRRCVSFPCWVDTELADTPAGEEEQACIQGQACVEGPVIEGQRQARLEGQACVQGQAVIEGQRQGQGGAEAADRRVFGRGRVVPVILSIPRRSVPSTASLRPSLPAYTYFTLERCPVRFLLMYAPRYPCTQFSLAALREPTAIRTRHRLSGPRDY